MLRDQKFKYKHTDRKNVQSGLRKQINSECLLFISKAGSSSWSFPSQREEEVTAASNQTILHTVSVAEDLNKINKYEVRWTGSEMMGVEGGIYIKLSN